MLVAMGLFMRQGDALLDLTEQEFSESEGIQSWIASHPKLLSGDEIDPAEPRRFLLVRREAPVAGFYLDHLFVDQDAIPTLLEAKKVSNPKSRREVVAQMLDYAANGGGTWTAEILEGWFIKRCEEEALSPDDELSALDHGFTSPGEFWQRAQDNLRAGNVRLIFAADKIQPSLQRIIEFLNERMVPTEVLAVEIRRQQAGDVELFSSTLVGQTERARDIKGASKKKPQAIGSLVKVGKLSEGAELWLKREILPSALQPESETDPRLRCTLKLDGGKPTLLYQPPGGETEELIPSKAPDRVRQVLDPSFTTPGYKAVNDAFSIEPGGPTLGELAVESGVWSDE